MNSGRPFQVVVWGATGFTGKLVCEHILKDYQGQLRWAIAGRNKQKLDGVKAELATVNAAAKDVPTLLADPSDQNALDHMVAQADVIITTAGPYDLYGTPIVDAAVRMKTHYCDITGEVWWVKRMAERYHYAAAEAGVNIVNCCGYDSIPFDMGVWFVAEHIRKTFNKKTASVVAAVVDGATAASGGTLASGAGLINQSADTIAAMEDPYYLINPPDERGGPHGPSSSFMSYNKVLGCWTGPHIMADANSKTVNRSWALLGRRYGDAFKYDEVMVAKSPVGAFLISMAVTLGKVLLKSKLLFGLLLRFAPKPGEGPSRDVMYNGKYRVKLVGTTQEEAGQQPTVVQAEFKGNGDPGYYITARWILETALCMALQMPDLRGSNDVVHGGVLTPASACGPILAQRLANAGTSLAVNDVKSPPSA